MTLQTAALGVPFAIVAAFFAYEAVAVGVPAWGLPSWSDLVSAKITGPPALTFLYGVIAGAVFLVLVEHFARLLPWWEP